MRPTRRGFGVVAIVVLTEVLAFAFGARSLNAIAAPALIALVGSVVGLARAGTPRVTRGPVQPGFPGDTREMRVEVAGSGVASVSQPTPEGLTATSTDTTSSLPGEFTVQLTYDRRGTYQLAPLEVRVTDLLGLVTKRFRVGDGVTVTVYPAVVQLAAGEQLLGDTLDTRDVERQEFDALREYVPGDPLRDVHWKSSAKATDTLYVKEFVDRRVEDEVVIVATADRDHGDAMATAAASVAAMALDAGVGVGLYTPQASVPVGRGDDHRAALFETLADATAGRVRDDEADGDIHIHADANGVDVVIGARAHSLAELTASHERARTGGTTA